MNEAPSKDQACFKLLKLGASARRSKHSMFDTSPQPSSAFILLRKSEFVFLDWGGREGVRQRSVEVPGKSGMKCDHVPPQAGIVKTENSL